MLFCSWDFNQTLRVILSGYLSWCCWNPIWYSLDESPLD